MTCIESKTRGDVYGNVKEIINDDIGVTPWMTEDILKCAATRHKQKTSNNKLPDKEESEADKSEHQISGLSLISSTTVNVGIKKGSTLTCVCTPP